MKRILVLPDIHVRKARNGMPPGEDKRALRTVLQYAGNQVKYDELIQLGDFWDLPYFRKKTELKKLKRDGILLKEALRWYEQDLEEGRKLLELLKGYAKKLVILEGNHDYRYKTLLEVMPHLEGRVRSPRSVVEEAGALWVPTWSKQGCVHKTEDINYFHGYYARQGSSAKLTAVNLFPAENVFFGHCHWEDTFAMPTRHQERQYVSQSCGCLCRYDQPYLGHKTTNWQQMFVEIFLKKRGEFSFYNHRLFNHRFLGPDGKEYRG